MAKRFVMVSILSSILLLWVEVVSAQAPTFTSSTADILAWNLSGFHAISDSQQTQIVRVLSDLDAEVVAAVEVNPDNVVHDIAAALTEHGTCYDALIVDQTASQNIGVIFKCNSQVSNPRLVPNSDDGNTRLRKALAIDVRIGSFDFLMIMLHLKAGRGALERATRDRQVTSIAEFIATETSGGERDVLVVGDYNMLPGDDDSNFTKLNPDGFLRFVSLDDLSGQFSHIASSGQCDGGNLLDGFAISAEHTAEYIEASLRIYPAHRALEMSLCDFRELVSDHLPLIGRFRILEDDDGGDGGGHDGAGVRIISVLSNPVNSDHNAEQVTLKNFSNEDASLLGWLIADDDGNEFPLSGSITANSTRVITLERYAMLNNDGDEVRLLSPEGLEHSVSYEAAQVESGQAIEFEP